MSVTEGVLNVQASGSPSTVEFKLILVKCLEVIFIPPLVTNGPKLLTSVQYCDPPNVIVLLPEGLILISNDFPDSGTKNC